MQFQTTGSSPYRVYNIDNSLLGGLHHGAVRGIED